MKGILLAGGRGTRLYPATVSTSKQLLPLAGKAMLYYPLVTLMEAGIWNICIITAPDEQERYQRLLGDGSRLGITLTWKTQLNPNGLPEAFIIAKDFIRNDPENVALILGDNLFVGLGNAFQNDVPWVPVIEVADARRYGVVSFGPDGRRISQIREKPKFTSSRWALAGLYCVPPFVVEIAEKLKPSARGELEIVDVLAEYLKRGQLRCHKLPATAIWMDCGTPEDLQEASALVSALEKRTGRLIGSPELASHGQGWITQDQLQELVRSMPSCRYRESLEQQLRGESLCQGKR